MMILVLDTTKQRRETRRPRTLSLSLGWKWPESPAWVVADRLVPQDDAAKFDFLGEAAAAVIGEAGVVVADDPRPVQPRCEVAQ